MRGSSLAAALLALTLLVVAGRVHAATTFYLQGVVAAVTPTVRGTWTGTCSGTPGVRQMASWKSGSYASTAITKTSGTSGHKCRVNTFVSTPLSGGAITGTLNFIAMTAESASTANIITALHAYVVTEADAVRCTLLTNVTTGAQGGTNEEWGNSSSTPTGTRTTNGTALTLETGSGKCDATGTPPQSGDRIVIEFGGAWNTTNTTRIGTGGFGGTSVTDLTAGSTTQDQPGSFVFSATLGLQATPTATATPTVTATPTATPTPTPTTTVTPNGTPPYRDLFERAAPLGDTWTQLSSYSPTTLTIESGGFDAATNDYAFAEYNAGTISASDSYACAQVTGATSSGNGVAACVAMYEGYGLSNWVCCMTDAAANVSFETVDTLHGQLGYWTSVHTWAAGDILAIRRTGASTFRCYWSAAATPTTWNAIGTGDVTKTGMTGIFGGAAKFGNTGANGAQWEATSRAAS